MRNSGSSGKILIIGPRAAGKTTFLAALAYLNDLGLRKPLLSVTPLNLDTERLREDARNILAKGGQFTPTENSPVYRFQFEVNAYFGTIL